MIYYIFIRKTITTLELIDLFINYVFKDFGYSKDITSD